MKRLRFSITCGVPDAQYRREVDGYEVPDTDGLLAVDKRGGTWRITHVPTGYGLGVAKPTMKSAVAFAQKLHRIGREHCVPLRSADQRYLAPRWKRALRSAGLLPWIREVV